MILFDHLDIWTLWLAIRRGRAGRRCGYLSCSNSAVTSTIRRALQRLGFSFVPVRSPYLDRREPGFYVAFSERLLSVALDRAEPEIEARLATWPALNDLERKRVARCLVLASFKSLKRALELLVAAERQSAEGVVVEGLVQRGGLANVVVAEAARMGLKVSTYNAPLRLRMVQRHGFLEHESDLWPNEATVRNFARWWAALIFAFTGLCRAGGIGNAKHSHNSRFDLVALNAKPEPTDWIDDLFWLTPLGETDAAKVLLLWTTSPTDKGWRRYDGRVGAQYDLKHVLRGSAAVGPAWRRIRSHHIKAMVSSARQVLVAMLGGQVSPWMAGWLLTLYERSGFYEAVMRHTGAKLAWAMNEGHELNTQAIAVAAARVGGVCAGASWSLKDSPNLTSSNNRNDVMFVWGPRQEEVFRLSGALIGKYVTAGYPLMRAISPALRSNPGPARRICLYDNAAGADTLITVEQARGAFCAFLDLVEERAEISAILKTKRNDFRALGPALSARVDALIETGRAELRSDHGDLAAGLGADVVAGFGASSLGLLAAQYGRHCVLFDPEGALKRMPIPQIEHLRIASSIQDFFRLLNCALDMAKPGTRTAGAVDAFADDMGARRVAIYLRTCADAFADGATAAIALARAESVVRELSNTNPWGAANAPAGIALTN